MNEKLTPAYSEYLGDIAKEYASGIVTEHSFRPALKNLIEKLESGILAVNEPKRIDCGAPDYVIKRSEITIGYIEAKDIGANLNEIEKSEQLKRYFKSLSNLVLTDYLEFRWYVNGNMRLSARLGTPANDGKIKRDREGIAAVAALLGNFISHSAEKVGTPKELAEKMARLAHMVRDLIIKAFNQEEEYGALHSQLAAFQENLIPDLSAEQFADMYAQTIAYGLFAARCTVPENSTFTRQNAAYLLPKTNPFLRKLFNNIAGPELDDRIAWLVDDLAQVLAQADMEAVLKNFGKHSGKEDPVVHFYETFLKAYDPKVREMRGVYYTPEPVVSYIVRSIDYLLKTRFNKPQGLADDNTLILDPATGTATFLYNVINEIYQSFAGQEGMWNDYVAEKLLKRIFGFELLMAPYAVAHLKLGLLLQGTGYKFHSDERLGIYLTNTLDEAIKHSDTLFAQWISEEANAAAEIKKEKPIMVVLGNPPYSVSSLNRSEWIGNLLDDYKQGLNEKKLNLDDDYIKFLRFAQWRIDKTGYGILGFITNNSYLDGLTHRQIRKHLLGSFSDIYILNLHGSSRRGEQNPNDIKDENVFAIQQGVAIGIFVKNQKNDKESHIYYSDMWGLKDGKYKVLLETDINSTSWQELKPSEPYYFFVPKDFSQKDEYNSGWSVENIFQLSQSGLQTDRDELFFDDNEQILIERMQYFFKKNYSEDFIQKYRICPSSSYDIEKRRDHSVFSKDNVKKCLYRPFDIFYLYYDNGLTSRSAYNVMQHMLTNNLALITVRQVAEEDFNHFLVTDLLVDRRITLSSWGAASIFPLYLYPAEGEMNFDGNERRPNLNPVFIKEMGEKLGLKFINVGKGNLAENFGPEDIFNYAYAVFHSPTYRTRYAEFLKINFPRLPLTSNKKLFKSLAERGSELVSLHLMESPVLDTLITKYPVDGSHKVEKVEYNENNQRVHINKTQYFEGVPPEVWDFQIGGYQVCHKWLKDRKDRTLGYDERFHYQKIIIALKETIRLMEEIDEIIPSWPIE